MQNTSTRNYAIAISGSKNQVVQGYVIFFSLVMMNVGVLLISYALSPFILVFTAFVTGVLWTILAYRIQKEIRLAQIKAKLNRDNKEADQRMYETILAIGKQAEQQAEEMRALLDNKELMPLE